MSISTISPNEFAKRWSSVPKPSLIDVRTPVEFREVHVDGAANVPLDRLNPAKLAAEHQASVARPLYVICKSGSRGQMACQQFVDAGIDSIINVEGGTMACVQAGIAAVRGTKAMSLERQVRIAAGSIVFVASIFGAFVHPGFIAVAGFVGAGLVFAGVTDTCGMGMMLAKMPWNQVSGNSGSCSTS